MRYILTAAVRDAEPAGSSERASAVWAWVLYDFANTIFSISILSVYFPGWLDELEAGPGLFNYILPLPRPRRPSRQDRGRVPPGGAQGRR